MFTQSEEVKEVALRLFPSYKGRKFQVQTFEGPMSLRSCWDGGSKDSLGMINLTTGKTGFVPENGTPFTDAVGDLAMLPLNCVLGRHAIFCGKDMGVTLYVHPDNLTKYLEAPKAELSRDEQIVLVATACYKPSYNGISNYRFCEAKSYFPCLTLERWEAAKALLIGKGLLNKAGAKTDAGRNVIEAMGHPDMYRLSHAETLTA